MDGVIFGKLHRIFTGTPTGVGDILEWKNNMYSGPQIGDFKACSWISSSSVKCKCSAPAFSSTLKSCGSFYKLYSQ